MIQVLLHMSVTLKACSHYAAKSPKICKANMKLELGTKPDTFSLRSEIACSIDFVEESSSHSLSNESSIASFKVSSSHSAI